MSLSGSPALNHGRHQAQQEPSRDCVDIARTVSRTHHRMPSNVKSSRPPRSELRRQEVRKSVPRQGMTWRSILRRPEFINSFLVGIGFVILMTLVVQWSRGQVKHFNGEVIHTNYINRSDYQVENASATQAKQEEARKNAPRVYTLNQQYLGRVEALIDGLPQAVADKTDISEIQDEVREEFNLTGPGLKSLQRYTIDGESTGEWKNWTSRLIQELSRHSPMISSQEYQKFATTVNRELLLPETQVGKGKPSSTLLSNEAIELLSDDEINLRSKLNRLALNAGFPEKVIPYVVSPIVNDPQSTLVHDTTTTELRASSAAEAVEPVMESHPRGEVIAMRGDILDSEKIDAMHEERAQFRALAPMSIIWMDYLGTIGLIGIITIVLISYAGVFYPRVLDNSIRLLALMTLVAALTITATVLTIEFPRSLVLAVVASNMVVSTVLVLSYDRRFAILASAMQCLLTMLALEQGLGLALVVFAGSAANITLLHEIRHRAALIRATTVGAIVSGIGFILLGMYQSVPTTAGWGQIFFNAMLAVVGMYLVGFLMLGILPSIEKLFDITTGLTLSELRDTRQPLLRQMQQKAPGTYNHSLQVANMAEAAAESIGGNGLLVYVGALYHDIGKINKPDYFIENQGEGDNKHDKLSPAMSLLVIVGHVKDGLELAREHGLPRVLHHFIESHHGTTLVEYFFQAAKNQAEEQGEDQEGIKEFEFRYPGPRPRTVEAAILLLADSVESAARAMADPNPSRIENLVKTMSRKKLEDGQFDDSPLTLQQLSRIEDSLIKSLCAIHHVRISYPSTEQLEEDIDQESVRVEAG